MAADEAVHDSRAEAEGEGIRPHTTRPRDHGVTTGSPGCGPTEQSYTGHMLSRCQGSHMRCTEQTCACPCHGGRPGAVPAPVATPKPPPKRRSVTASRPGPKRIQARLDKEIRDVVQTYNDGASTVDLALAYGCDRKTVVRALTRAGVVPTNRGPRTNVPHLTQLQARVDAGAGISELAREYGVDRRTIYRALGRGDMRRAEK
jgi:uncharacterized protein (DUF433 family)